MAIVKKMTKRGFTLIELMIVVVIIGILAALAIYGVQKYVSNSKSAEARMMLGRMSKDMLTFYEGENQAYDVLSLGGTAAITRSLCPPTGNPVPAAVPSKAKVQPSPAEFKDGEGWECLKTTISTPIYYQYALTSSQTGSYAGRTLLPAATGNVFAATATGNLDGDAVNSTFTMEGNVQATASGDQALVLSTTVLGVNEEE